MSVTARLTKYWHYSRRLNKMFVRVKCPHCSWSEFKGEQSVGMTPCHNCNSTGYIETDADIERKLELAENP